MGPYIGHLCAYAIQFSKDYSLCLCAKHRPKSCCYRLTVRTQGLTPSPIGCCEKGQLGERQITRGVQLAANSRTDTLSLAAEVGLH